MYLNPPPPRKIYWSVRMGFIYRFYTIYLWGALITVYGMFTGNNVVIFIQHSLHIVLYMYNIHCTWNKSISQGPIVDSSLIRLIEEIFIDFLWCAKKCKNMWNACKVTRNAASAFRFIHVNLHRYSGFLFQTGINCTYDMQKYISQNSIISYLPQNFIESSVWDQCRSIESY